MMKQSKLTLAAAVTVVFFLFCLLAAAAFWKYTYPFGRRPGGISLPGVYGALVAFAGDHDGWFPRSAKGSYDALQQLYPEYCPSGIELAGVSGNISAVVDALRGGKLLDASLTSWVYVQGFRIDDPKDIAILWESKPGLYYDGRRNNFGGRAVLLISGYITNVPAAEWERFQKHQEQLRNAVLARRAEHGE